MMQPGLEGFMAYLQVNQSAARSSVAECTLFVYMATHFAHDLILFKALVAFALLGIR